MAPKYKLTYFDLSGLGEPIRYLLSYGDLEFEDNRISRENWPSVKPTIPGPLAQMPILEFDGKALFQSNAICRYVANEVGLAGATPLENWEIDAVVDTIIDFRTKISNWFWEKDEARKQSIKGTLEKEHFPFFLSRFDEWAKKNNGYLAIDKLTWADLSFVANLETINELCAKEFGKTCFESGYPNLEGLKKTVFAIPGIKAWLDRRPPSHF